jgi:hypothetical protein
MPVDFSGLRRLAAHSAVINPDLCIVNRTPVRNHAPLVVGTQDDDLLGIAEHRDIGIVGYDDNLSSFFRPTQDRDETLIDKLAV